MGASDFVLFDDNWLFARYGLQADGTTLPEPEGLQNPGQDDLSWRKLDLPHDWAIEGPGEIVATDAGDPTSYVPFQSHDREAFNGMALVIVKAGKEGTGPFKVIAESQGLQPATLQIRMK
jgi:hypothetical protein